MVEAIQIAVGGEDQYRRGRDIGLLLHPRQNSVAPAPELGGFQHEHIRREAPQF